MYLKDSFQLKNSKNVNLISRFFWAWQKVTFSKNPKKLNETIFFRSYSFTGNCVFPFDETTIISVLSAYSKCVEQSFSNDHLKPTKSLRKNEKLSEFELTDKTNSKLGKNMQSFPVFTSYLSKLFCVFFEKSSRLDLGPIGRR